MLSAPWWGPYCFSAIIRSSSSSYSWLMLSQLVLSPIELSCCYYPITTATFSDDTTPSMAEGATCPCCSWGSRFWNETSTLYYSQSAAGAVLLAWWKASSQSTCSLCCTLLRFVSPGSDYLCPRLLAWTPTSFRPSTATCVILALWLMSLICTFSLNVYSTGSPSASSTVADHSFTFGRWYQDSHFPCSFCWDSFRLHQLCACRWLRMAWARSKAWPTAFCDQRGIAPLSPHPITRSPCSWGFDAPRTDQASSLVISRCKLAGGWYSSDFASLTVSSCRSIVWAGLILNYQHFHLF